MQINTEIGKRIKERRESLGMTQDELAKKLGYTSRSTVNKVEKGIHDVSQSNVVKYANALDTTPAYLMGWEILDKIAETNEVLNKMNQDQLKRVIEYAKFILNSEMGKQ